MRYAFFYKMYDLFNEGESYIEIVVSFPGKRSSPSYTLNKQSNGGSLYAVND